MTPHVKDITFCFEEMNSAVSPMAREYLLSLDPHNLLSTWLQALTLETLGLETEILFSNLEKQIVFQILIPEFLDIFHF